MPASSPSLADRLQAGLDALGLDLPSPHQERLLAYLGLLVRWNRSYNLTAVRDPAEMVTRHLLDSLAIAGWVEGASACDLGSGAGLPGIVLAIIAPECRWQLVDSNGKKARFLRAAVRELQLDNVQVSQQRVQDLPGTFDCISARAFASLPDMLAWAGHLLAPQGRWLAMKGRYPEDELQALPSGWQVRAVHALQVPGLDSERHLVVLTRADS